MMPAVRTSLAGLLFLLMLVAAAAGGCGDGERAPPDAWIVVDGARTKLHVTGYCWGDAECVDAEPGSTGPSVEVVPGQPFSFEYDAGPPASVIVTAFRTAGEGDPTPLAPAAGGWRAPDVPGTYAVSVAGTWPGKGDAAYSLLLRVVR